MRSSTSVVSPVAEDVARSRSRRGDQPAGHSFSPSAIRDACQRSSVSTIPAIRPRIRSASPRWLPLNRSGRCTLRIQNADATPTSTSTRRGRRGSANQPCVAEPRQRRVLRDGADQRHHDRREEDEEAPEDERVDQARDEPLEQLLLAEHDDRLVAHALRHVVEALRPACPSRTSRVSSSARRAKSAAEHDEERATRASGGERRCSMRAASHEPARQPASAPTLAFAGARRRSPAAPRAGRRSRRSRRST